MTSYQRHGIPNHRQLDCVFNSLPRLTKRHKQNFALLGPLWGKSTGGENFNVWRHNGLGHMRLGWGGDRRDKISSSHFLFRGAKILNCLNRWWSSGSWLHCTESQLMQSSGNFFVVSWTCHKQRVKSDTVISHYPYKIVNSMSNSCSFRLSAPVW